MFCTIPYPLNGVVPHQSKHILDNKTNTDAQCAYDQQLDCRHAATDKSAASNGYCESKAYVAFTHSCFRNNKLPVVDYCCCKHPDERDVIMCCRYVQAWDHYRCVESEDRLNSTLTASSVNLEVLVPSILIPLLCLLVCVLCCYRRCCLDRYEMDDGQIERRNKGTTSFCSCSYCCVDYDATDDVEIKPRDQLRHQFIYNSRLETAPVSPVAIASTNQRSVILARGPQLTNHESVYKTDHNIPCFRHVVDQTQFQEDRNLILIPDILRRQTQARGLQNDPLTPYYTGSGGMCLVQDPECLGFGPTAPPTYEDSIYIDGTCELEGSRGRSGIADNGNDE